jgi:hypothetical protein
MGENFKVQREQRIAEFQQRMKDEAEDFARRRQLAQREHAQALTELQSQYNRERIQRREAFNQRMQDLIAELQYEYKLKKEFTDAEIAYILGAINAVRSQVATTTGGRASGGYVSNGLYSVGERGYEYVLSHDTTRKLEDAFGGQLSQDKLLAALSGSKGARVANVSIPVTVNGNPDARTIANLERAMRRVANEAIVRAVGA